MANLSYIKNFRFSSSAKDELGYCLTSIEAAIEYIRQGSLSIKPPVRSPPALTFLCGCHGMLDRVLRLVWGQGIDS